MTSLLMHIVLALSAIQVAVETLDGQASTGALVDMGQDRMILMTDAGPREFLFDDLLSVRPTSQVKPAEPGDLVDEPQVWLELVDGSYIPARDYTVRDQQAHLVLIDGSSVEVPLRSIAAVSLQKQNEAIARQWRDILSAEITGDMVVILKQQFIDFWEGVLGDVSQDVIHFHLEDQQVSVPRRKVQGLIYYRGGTPDLAEPICTIAGPHGMRIRAQSATLVDGKIRAIDLSGSEWIISRESLGSFDFSVGKVQYLSDLVPESNKWTPFFGIPDDATSIVRFGSTHQNLSLEGGALRVGGKEYKKGLAIRSRSQITYRLSGEFRQFSAVAGIDDRVGDRGHVRLVLRGDDRELFAETITGSDEPLPLKLNITGVKRLTILVDYGDDLDLADHLDLCDARISK